MRKMSFVILCLFAHGAHAQPARQPTTGILQLDGLSYISFDGRGTYSLPAGSTIRFQFGTPKGGSVPFTIQPADVSIAPISVGNGATLRYALASVASGSMQRAVGQQPTMSLAATLAVTLEDADGSATTSYGVSFTTEGASASSADGQRNVAIQGMRIVEGARYVQLVTAATNKRGATPAGGSAVTAVLSGTFDVLPTLP